MHANVFFISFQLRFACGGCLQLEAALQCAEGPDLYKLADFLFRGFNLARDQLATAPRCIRVVDMSCSHMAGPSHS